MNIQIINIIDRGISSKERLYMRVLADTDLSYYIIFDTTYTSSNSISNLQRHAFWFESKKVKAGDYIILYTKGGKPSESVNADGSKNYFLYWGLDRTIWNKAGDCAVLFEVNSWQTSRYE